MNPHTDPTVTLLDAAPSEPTVASSVDADIDAAIRTMLDPHGGPGHEFEKALAFEVLSLHPEIATGKLLTLVTGEAPPVNVLLALGRLGRDEAVDPLAHVLETAIDPTTVIAAQALGEHPSARALEALQQALRSERPQVVASAAIGLSARGDEAACPALDAAASHPDVHARTWVTRARRQLGCL